jgi:hypothetical protein
MPWRRISQTRRGLDLPKSLDVVKVHGIVAVSAPQFQIHSQSLNGYRWLLSNLGCKMRRMLSSSHENQWVNKSPVQAAYTDDVTAVLKIVPKLDANAQGA